MAGKSSINDNFAPGPPATRFIASGKNRDFYTFDNAAGAGAYATGGTIIDGGDGYIYHIFTGTGTFAVNRPPAAIDSVDYLIVAGGGGAAPFPAPGANAGGGGGGFLFGNIGVLNAPGSYPISVGGGGPSGPGQPAAPRNGSPSTAFGLTATAGGGAAGGAGAANIPGAPGGSGGGGYAGGGGGVGNTPTTIPRQGYTGGGAPPSGANAGGGGGAGGGGTAALAPLVPVGGAGGPGRIAPEFPSTIVGQTIPAPVLPAWQPLVGPGGYSAGGHGRTVPAPLQRTSPVNSGYGGQTGGISGGSGIVCIRYKKVAPYSRATGGTIEPSTNPEHPGVVRHIFTGPGTFAVTDPTLQYIDYLAVGGGGGGGVPGGGGGGGAGGFVSSIHTSTTTPTSIPQAYPWNPGHSVQVGEQYPVGAGSYPIGIGTGGNVATVGNNTTIGVPGPSQIIAAGGGRGGFFGGAAGGSGGSGGGGFSSGLSVFPGGTASPSPLIQGNPGGEAGPSSVATGGGGGGAGAGGAGVLNGGVGWYSVLSPSAYGTPGPLTPNTLYRYFAGGGGGFPAPRPAGSGGGGPTNTSGTTNTGGGGGGSGTSGAGGSGGPGIVIIQYPE